MTDEQQQKLQTDQAPRPADFAEPNDDPAQTVIAPSASIPLPLSIVSSHTEFATKKVAGTQNPSIKNEYSSWKKPRVMIGLVLTFLFMLLEILLFYLCSSEASIFCLCPQALLMSFYWSYCIFTVAGGFTYSSPAARRYSRAWNALLAFFLHPLSMMVLVSTGELFLQLLIRYRGVNEVGEIMRAFFWIVSIALLFAPVFAARAYYKFLLRLEQLTNQGKGSAGATSRLHALTFSACHLIPVALFYIFFILSLFINSTSIVYLNAAFNCFPIIILITQLGSFYILRITLNDIKAKTHIF